MNAKVNLEVYKLKIPLNNSMIIGIDICNEGKKKIIGFCSSYNSNMSKYFS